MAINMRRGLKKDFDPQKMTPGEWAVSIDNSTENQIVWMCFAAGVVKRMSTYEDSLQMIRDATDDIKSEYVLIFDEIKSETEVARNAAQEAKNQAQSAYEQLASTEIGELKEDLHTGHATHDALKDSSGETLLDSSGNYIIGTVLYADAGDIESIKKQLSAIENVILGISRKIAAINESGVKTNEEIQAITATINNVIQHALLDSDYAEINKEE